MPMRIIIAYVLIMLIVSAVGAAYFYVTKEHRTRRKSRRARHRWKETNRSTRT
jgi:flagellar basal body-associated protein FliL